MRIIDRTISGNSWGATHNEWDIVWNTAYYVPDYHQDVLVLSGSNNDAYVLDRRAADAASCAALTGNRSHVFVGAAAGTLTAGPASGNINLPYATIALGINAVVPGGTINVAAGTYDPFKVISKNLTIIGTGNPVVTGALDVSADITLPRFTLGGKVTKTVALVKNSTVNLSGLDFEGSALVTPGTSNFGFALIYENSNGTVDDIIASPNDDISSTPDITMFGTTGIGIWKYNSVDPMDVTVKNSTVKLFGNMGITVWNGAKAQIEDNTIIGQVYAEANKEIYGINVDDTFYTSGAHAVTEVTITGNEIYNCDNTVSPADARDQAAALHLNASLEYDNGGLVTLESKVTITNNILRDNRIGIYAVHGGPANISANNNSIYNSRLYDVASKPSVSGENVEFNAKNNWWGDTSGPGTSDMSGSVAFTPWYTDSGMTKISYGANTDAVISSSQAGQADLPAGATEIELNDTTALDLSSGILTIASDDVSIGGSTVTLTQSVILNSGTADEPVVLTNADLADVSASIPDGTTIKGPAGWDGTIQPPMATAASGSAPAGFSVGDTVISIGSPDGTLVFNNPVTLLLAGVTGDVGYKPAGSDTWIQITNICGGSYNTPNAPTAPGECAISNGTDTKIVTYHFTSFGGLNKVVSPSVSISSGGSSSGGGNICGSGFVWNPSTMACVQSVATVLTPAISPVQGRVLGAAVYNFASDLTVGSHGADVTALQQFLIDSGYAIPAGATGYFGTQTKTAVIAFQKARGITQTGYVGPLTRTALNKGSSGLSGFTALQANAIAGVLSAFGVDDVAVNKARTALTK
ncbi:MAG: peptidoglycan-binding protein [Candidatus Kaiserbacteria bacterium]|nr:peptidoglycan-binding protein [Candidatus Kaiserbacteria bacterium]